MYNIQVEDLMVPEELRSQYKAEAESLLSVEITKLDLQWLQVQILIKKYKIVREKC